MGITLALSLVKRYNKIAIWNSGFGKLKRTKREGRFEGQNMLSLYINTCAKRDEWRKENDDGVFDIQGWLHSMVESRMNDKG